MKIPDLKYHLIILLLWFSSGKLTAQVPFTCEGQFFITLTTSNTSSLLNVNIDPITGNVAFITLEPNLGVLLNSIGYRSTDNLIYGLDPVDFHLYRIDSNGDVETLTTLPLNPAYTYFSADITPDGNYMILIGGGGDLGTGEDKELVKVDLNTPGYDIETSQISGSSSTRIYDIAFDPLSGVLYGFDTKNHRLATVDHTTGIVSSNYPEVNNIDTNGSLFFDAFGNLFAYGSASGFDQNTLYQANTITGLFTVLSVGPEARGSDACTCPYTIEITKTVSREEVFPCSEVIYTFSIANATGRLQEGIDFEDVLPTGFKITEVIDNPFEGNLQIALNEKGITIKDMEIPAGIDSIRIRVEIGNLPNGVYKNQAILTDLPLDLGEFRLSDNPRTLIENDSTSILIKSLDFDTLRLDAFLCTGENLVLDVSPYGEAWIWQDGTTVPFLEVDHEGEYRVDITAGCDAGTIIFDAKEAMIKVDFPDVEINLSLGDSILLSPSVQNTSNLTFYNWTDPLDQSLSCLDCSEAYARPLFDTRYKINVANEGGCRDSAIIQLRVDKTRRVYIPNAFSPDGDGVNDIFYIMGSGYGEIKDFKIFDRWGEVVYSNEGGFINSFHHGWDGFFKGKEMDSGVFVYFAEIEFLDGLTEIFRGDVTLMR